jgi:hypothetical protein
LDGPTANPDADSIRKFHMTVKKLAKKDFYTAKSPENAAVTALSRVSWCLGGV